MKISKQSTSHTVEERRTQIADAVFRVIISRGVAAVTMRSVAEEAAVSLRLVQYYFGTKSELLRECLAILERRAVARWDRRLLDLPEPTSTRNYIVAFCDEALPTDEASREFHHVFVVFAAAAITDPDLASLPFLRGPQRRETELASELARGIDSNAIKLS